MVSLPQIILLSILLGTDCVSDTVSLYTLSLTHKTTLEGSTFFSNFAKETRIQVRPVSKPVLSPLSLPLLLGTA